MQKLLLYYDSSRQWPAVYKKGLSCEQKEAVLSINHKQVKDDYVIVTQLQFDSNQIINLSAVYEHANCRERHILNDDNVTYNRTMIDCHYFR